MLTHYERVLGGLSVDAPSETKSFTKPGAQSDACKRRLKERA